MENEALVEEILAVVEQLLQAAGPEWTLEFLNAGLQEASQGGGEQMPPEQQSGPPKPPPPLPGGTRIGR